MNQVLTLNPKYVEARLTRLESTPEVRLWRAALCRAILDTADSNQEIRSEAIEFISSSGVLKLMDNAVIDRKRVKELRLLVENGHAKLVKNKLLKRSNGRRICANQYK